MKKSVLIVMSVILAAILLPTTTCFAEQILIGERHENTIEGPGFVVSTNGGPSFYMKRPDGTIDSPNAYQGNNRGNNSIVVIGRNNRDRGYNNNSGYNNNYGCDNRSRDNKSKSSIGLSGKVLGIKVNVKLDKTTFSKPRAQPQVVKIDQSRMTLMDEDTNRVISPIAVTNPTKILVRGTKITFSRNNSPIAEYTVTRISGDLVYATADYVDQAPKAGDNFTINTAIAEPTGTDHQFQ